MSVGRLILFVERRVLEGALEVLRGLFSCFNGLHNFFHPLTAHCIAFLEEMLRFSVEVLFGFDFVASVAFDSSAEVIVLALGAHPPSIRKIEGCGGKSLTLAYLTTIGFLQELGLLVSACLGAQDGRVLALLSVFRSVAA